jgi:hypothetical protein
MPNKHLCSSVFICGFSLSISAGGLTYSMRTFLLFLLAVMVAGRADAAEGATALFPEAPALRAEAAKIGKPEWRPMLQYAVGLHVRGTHPAFPPFTAPWEELGPGYGYGPAFGHWDVVHEILDVMPTAPQHALQQLLNDVRLQLPNGYLPGSIYMPGAPGATNGRATFDPAGQSHPPLWVVAADDYLRQTGDHEHLRDFFAAVTRQIGWFEQARRAQPDGFFYTDIRDHKWESGVDEGVRFDSAARGPKACIDATCHVYQLCDFAAKWAAMLGEDPAPWAARAERLRHFITTRLWDERSGFFYDIWAIEDPKQQTGAFEGLWPLIVGAAEPEQARRVIDGWLLNPKRFLTKHPIPTVAVDDPKFELRMWRGPSWNSMTYWAARGCVRYGRADAAVRLLEPALDDTAAQFGRTGTIWEFYHPFGGHPEDLHRKPQTKRNQPWTDYLGHNPVLAMTRMWAAASKASPRHR